MITTSYLTLAPGQSPETLWTYTVAATGEAFSFGPPVFEIDGQVITASVDALEAVSDSTRRLPNGVTIQPLAGGLARIDATFDAPGGKCVFFGAD